MYRPGDIRGGGPDRELARLAALAHGVVSHRRLRALGFSDTQIATRVTRGQLHRLHEGVYAVGHPGITLPGRFLAAVLACGPGAVLSHSAACALHDLRGWDDRPLVDVLVRDTTPRSHRGVDLHRTLWLPTADTTRVLGIPVTTAARSLVDAAAQLDRASLRRAVRQGLASKRTSIPQLVEVLERLGPRRGVRAMREILATGHQPTRSELEDVALAFLLRRYAQPDVNVPLWIEGRKVIPDFRWARQHLILEVDGRRWHDDPISRADDAERQALLEAQGERVLRATFHQIVREPSQTYARLDAAGAPIVN